MAIITTAECMLLSCSTCGAQFLLESSRVTGHRQLGEVDDQCQKFLTKHRACPPRELIKKAPEGYCPCGQRGCRGCPDGAG